MRERRPRKRSGDDARRNRRGSQVIHGRPTASASPHVQNGRPTGGRDCRWNPCNPTGRTHIAHGRSGRTPPPPRLGMLAHRRRTSGRWGAMVGLGARIRAANLEGFTAYRKPQPLQEKWVPAGLVTAASLSIPKTSQRRRSPRRSAGGLPEPPRPPNPGVAARASSRIAAAPQNGRPGA